MSNYYNAEDNVNEFYTQSIKSEKISHCDRNNDLLYSLPTTEPPDQSDIMVFNEDGEGTWVPASSFTPPTNTLLNIEQTELSSGQVIVAVGGDEQSTMPSNVISTDELATTLHIKGTVEVQNVNDDENELIIAFDDNSNTVFSNPLKEFNFIGTAVKLNGTSIGGSADLTPYEQALGVPVAGTITGGPYMNFDDSGNPIVSGGRYLNVNDSGGITLANDGGIYASLNVANDGRAIFDGNTDTWHFNTGNIVINGGNLTQQSGGNYTIKSPDNNVEINIAPKNANVCDFTSVNCNYFTFDKPIFAESNLVQTSQNGSSGDRPAGAVIGQMYFDTTLGMPLWYNGSNYVDATGTVPTDFIPLINI